MQTKTKMKLSINETLEISKELKAMHLHVHTWNTNLTHIISCKLAAFFSSFSDNLEICNVIGG